MDPTMNDNVRVQRVLHLRDALLKSSNFGRPKTSPITLSFSSRTGAYTTHHGESHSEVLNDDALWTVDISKFSDGYVSEQFYNMPPVFYPPGDVPEKLPVGTRPIKSFVAVDGDRWVRFETSSRSGLEEVCGFQYVIAKRLDIHKKYIYPQIRFTSKMCHKNGHPYFKPVFQIIDWNERLPGGVEND